MSTVSSQTARTELAEGLERAEQFYKLALAVRMRCAEARNHPGKPKLTNRESALGTEGEPISLELDKQAEETASGMLETAATAALAVELDNLLEAALPDRFNHPDRDLRAACCLVRSLRDSLAESPFGGVWRFDPRWKYRLMDLEGVFSLFPPDLEGKRIRRRDFGGPLAMVRLLALFRSRLA